MSTRNTQHYDAVIAGARCAGAATALLLARQGARVLLLDKSRYGTDTLSTHALMRGAVLRLHNWGLLPRVIAAGTPPVRSAIFYLPGAVSAVEIKPKHGVDKDRVEDGAARCVQCIDAVPGLDLDSRVGARQVEGRRPDRRRPRGDDVAQQAPPVQLQYPAAHECVSRQGVRAVPGPVQQQYPCSLAGQEHGRCGARAAGAGDDHVVVTVSG